MKVPDLHQPGSAGRKLAQFVGKSIPSALVLAIWCLLLWRVIAVFGPDSSYVFFNSDGAIPILMANDDRPITVFDTYYYGSDRWGAWPLLAARLIHQEAKYRWSDKAVHTVRAVWLFLAIFVLALLDRVHWKEIVVICLAAITMHSTIRLQLFDISQVYAWQITSIVSAWYSLRRLVGEGSESSSRRSAIYFPAWSVPTFFFSFLAIWSSYASGPLLLFVAGLGIFRDYVSRGRPLNRSRALRYIFGLGIVAAAILIDVLMRVNYHRHGLKHYGSDFKTQVGLDVGYLGANLIVQLRMFWHFTWWPLTALALGALLGLVGFYVYCSVRRNVNFKNRLRPILVTDRSVLIFGTCGIAMINFALIVMVDHVRLDLYNNRFATLTMLFGSISGLLLLFQLFRVITTRLKIDALQPALCSVAAILLIIAFPGKSYSPLYRHTKEAALTIAEKAPQSILMGGYWQTYVFAALQPVDTIIPLPFEGDEVRIPWTRQKLAQTEQIVIEYRQSKFAPGNSPPPTTTQYGNLLTLADPRFYENDEYAFALYLNEHAVVNASKELRH